MIKSNRYANLDAARGVASQFVLLAHAYLLLYNSDGSMALGWFARLAVIVFFVVSGFSIATGIRRDILKNGQFDCVEYAIRRVARIYPPYLFAMALVAILAATIGLANADASIMSWVRGLCFLYMTDDAMTVGDGPIWSLRVEVGLYVLTAVGVLAIQTTGAARIALALSTFALALLFCVKQFYAPTAMVLYSLGAAAIFYGRKAALQSVAVLLAIVSAGLLLIPLVFPQLADNSPASLLFQALLGFPVVAMLVATRDFKLERTPIAKVCTATGGWSYSLYILHWPICLALKHIAGGPSMALFFAGLIVANVIAYVAAIALERPAFFAAIARLWIAKLRRTSPSRQLPRAGVK